MFQVIGFTVVFSFGFAVGAYYKACMFYGREDTNAGR